MPSLRLRLAGLATALLGTVVLTACTGEGGPKQVSSRDVRMLHLVSHTGAVHNRALGAP